LSQIGGQIAQGAGTGATAPGDCSSARRLSAAAEVDAKHAGRWRLFCWTGGCRPDPGGRRTSANQSDRSHIVCV